MFRAKEGDRVPVIRKDISRVSIYLSISLSLSLSLMKGQIREKFLRLVSQEWPRLFPLEAKTRRRSQDIGKALTKALI